MSKIFRFFLPTDFNVIAGVKKLNMYLDFFGKTEFESSIKIITLNDYYVAPTFEASACKSYLSTYVAMSKLKYDPPFGKTCIIDETVS